MLCNTYRFDEMPDEPRVLLAEGCELFLVSSQTGIVREVAGLHHIRSLSSFRRIDLTLQPGALMTPTVDTFSSPGTVQLVHTDPACLEADYRGIRQLEMSSDIFHLMR